MKKLFLCLLLTLSLTACGPSGASGAAPGGQTEPVETGAEPTESAQTAVTDGDRNPTAEELGRPEATDLTFFVEGQEETMPATLYIGQGYSLYIPTEGWNREVFTENGVPADSWESTDSDRAELRILHLGQRSLEDCRNWVIQELSDYVISEDQQGGLYGEDTEEGMVMDVRFHEGGGNVYAVTWTYPMEAAEGFGTRLSVLADTFEVMS